MCVPQRLPPVATRISHSANPPDVSIRSLALAARALSSWPRGSVVKPRFQPERRGKVFGVPPSGGLNKSINFPPEGGTPRILKEENTYETHLHLLSCPRPDARRTFLDSTSKPRR